MKSKSSVLAPTEQKTATLKKRKIISKTKLSVQLQYQAFLLPILIVYTLLMVYPLFKAFYYSLTNFGGYDRNFDFVGMQNYIALFNDNAIIASLGFTIFYAVLSTILITMLAIPLAIVLDTKFFGRDLTRAAFFFPAIPSTLLLGFVWGFILSPISSGVLNSALNTLFGIEAIQWLSDPTLAKVSTLIVAVWNQTGWHAIIYLAFLQAISKDYYEAAEIDGANALQKFKNITFPMLAPAMTISVMLLLTNGMKVYEMPYALTGGGPGYSTYTLTQVIIQRGVAESNYSLASAISIVFFIIVLAITLFQVTVMQKREEKMR